MPWRIVRQQCCTFLTTHFPLLLKLNNYLFHSMHYVMEEWQASTLCFKLGQRKAAIQLWCNPEIIHQPIVFKTCYCQNKTLYAVSSGGLWRTERQEEWLGGAEMLFNIKLQHKNWKKKVLHDETKGVMGFVKIHWGFIYENRNCLDKWNSM